MSFGAYNSERDRNVRRALGAVQMDRHPPEKVQPWEVDPMVSGSPIQRVQVIDKYLPEDPLEQEEEARQFALDWAHENPEALLAEMPMFRRLSDADNLALRKAIFEKDKKDLLEVQREALQLRKSRRT